MEPITRALYAVVGGLLVLTLVGLGLLWPDRAALPDHGPPPEPLVEGRILTVESFQAEADPVVGTSGESARLEVEVLEGTEAGEVVTIETLVEGYPTFRAGDEVMLARSERPEGEVAYFVADFKRTTPLMLLLVLFVGAVLAVSRWKGLRALVGLGASLLVVTHFIVPGIVTGRSPVLVALVGATAVMLVTLYLSHGLNAMTTVAVVGTTAALALTIGVGSFFVEFAKLTGFASEEANLARFAVEGLDLGGLVLAGLIIAALGVLDDVTVSQASTVFQLHDANPGQSWTELFTRAMRVGRDHIASVINTLFLVYAGASLALLVLFSTGGMSTREIVNTEIFAEEIVKIVVGSLGLISAVPFVTALAAAIATRRAAGQLSPPHAHTHAPSAADAVGTAAAPRRAGSPSPAVRAAPGALEALEDEESLDEEERAYRAWVRFLRDGGTGQFGGEQGADRGDEDR